MSEVWSDAILLVMLMIKGNYGGTRQRVQVSFDHNPLHLWE